MLSVENEERKDLQEGWKCISFNFSPFQILACGLSEPRTTTFLLLYWALNAALLMARADFLAWWTQAQCDPSSFSVTPDK